MAPTRRHLLEAGAVLVGASAAPRYAFAAVDLTPTDSIGGPPEYIPGAPMRTSLLPDGPATEHIRIFGRALSTKGAALRDARLDVWQTDAAGVYDKHGFKFRGRQFTDARGRFRLDTRMPGPYGGIRHVHFMLTARTPGAAQPRMVPGVFYFPTEEEFLKYPKIAALGECFNPKLLRTVGGVVMAPCDIVLEV